MNRAKSTHQHEFSYVFVWFSLFESGYHYVGQAGLELTTFLSLSVSPPSNTRIANVSSYAPLFQWFPECAILTRPGGKVVSLLLGMIQNTLLLEQNLFWVDTSPSRDTPGILSMQFLLFLSSSYWLSTFHHPSTTPKCKLIDSPKALGC